MGPRSYLVAALVLVLGLSACMEPPVPADYEVAPAGDRPRWDRQLWPEGFFARDAWAHWGPARSWLTEPWARRRTAERSTERPRGSVCLQLVEDGWMPDDSLERPGEPASLRVDGGPTYRIPTLFAASVGGTVPPGLEHIVEESRKATPVGSEPPPIYIHAPGAAAWSRVAELVGLGRPQPTTVRLFVAGGWSASAWMELHVTGGGASLRPAHSLGVSLAGVPSGEDGDFVRVTVADHAVEFPESATPALLLNRAMFIEEERAATAVEVAWGRIEAALRPEVSGGRIVVIDVARDGHPVRYAYVVTLLDILGELGVKDVVFPRAGIAVRLVDPVPRVIHRRHPPPWLDPLPLGLGVGLLLAVAVFLPLIGRRARAR